MQQIQNTSGRSTLATRLNIHDSKMFEQLSQSVQGGITQTHSNTNNTNIISNNTLLRQDMEYLYSEVAKPRTFVGPNSKQNSTTYLAIRALLELSSSTYGCTEDLYVKFKEMKFGFDSSFNEITSQSLTARSEMSTFQQNIQDVQTTFQDHRRRVDQLEGVTRSIGNIDQIISSFEQRLQVNSSSVSSLELQVREVKLNLSTLYTGDKIEQRCRELNDQFQRRLTTAEQLIQNLCTCKADMSQIPAIVAAQINTSVSPLENDVNVLLRLWELTKTDVHSVCQNANVSTRVNLLHSTPAFRALMDSLPGQVGTHHSVLVGAMRPYGENMFMAASQVPPIISSPANALQLNSMNGIINNNNNNATTVTTTTISSSNYVTNSRPPQSVTSYQQVVSNENSPTLSSNASNHFYNIGADHQQVSSDTHQVSSSLMNTSTSNNATTATKVISAVSETVELPLYAVGEEIYVGDKGLAFAAQRFKAMEPHTVEKNPGLSETRGIDINFATLPTEAAQAIRLDSHSKAVVNSTPTVPVAIVQGSNAHTSNVQSSTVQGSNAHTSNVQSSIVQGSNAHTSNVQSSTVQGSNAQSSTVQGSNAHTANVQSSIVQGSNTSNASSNTTNSSTSVKSSAVEIRSSTSSSATTPLAPVPASALVSFENGLHSAAHVFPESAAQMMTNYMTSNGTMAGGVSNGHISNIYQTKTCTTTTVTKTSSVNDTQGMSIPSLLISQGIAAAQPAPVVQDNRNASNFISSGKGSTATGYDQKVSKDFAVSSRDLAFSTGTDASGYQRQISSSSMVTKTVSGVGKSEHHYVEPENNEITVNLDLGMEISSNSTGGVLVRAVNPLSCSDRAGLVAGDIILTVNDDKVWDAVEMVQRIHAAVMAANREKRSDVGLKLTKIPVVPGSNTAMLRINIL